MAKPYREGKGWAVRFSHKHEKIYLSGYRTAAEAEKAERNHLHSLEASGRPAGAGPHRTTVATAFQKYALERLPGLKGAPQDARRINDYLRALRLPVIKVHSIPARDRKGAVYHEVTSAREPEQRRIPNSLKNYREKQRQNRAESDRLKAGLARTLMSEVTPHQIQNYLNALLKEGYSASTLELERSQLRRLFSHASKVWLWNEPERNPATGLDLPMIRNERKRVITNEEWDRLKVALGGYANPQALLGFILLLETTMRTSEPILQARWRDVDWRRRLLNLPDAKTGARQVPLSPEAFKMLEALKAQQPDAAPDGNVLSTSYEALKKAWKTACRKAGVENAVIYDLRRTGATRYAWQFNGNIFILQQITGHKTVKMLMRYVGVNPESVARLMNDGRFDLSAAPAGFTQFQWHSPPILGLPSQLNTPNADAPERPLPANVVAFPGRRAA